MALKSLFLEKTLKKVTKNNYNQKEFNFLDPLVLHTIADYL